MTLLMRAMKLRLKGFPINRRDYIEGNTYIWVKLGAVWGRKVLNQLKQKVRKMLVCGMCVSYVW